MLVIDDDRRLRAVLERSLSGHYQVEVASDARVALDRILQGRRFDVILCDLDMPTMGGIEFHRCLAERLPEEAARIVFMTGGALGATAEAFLARAANVLLDKPLEPEGVFALIDRRIRAGVIDHAGASLTV